MDILVLSDNTASPGQRELQTEHGLSLWITTDRGERILCDMGKGALYWNNATALGIDPKECDWAFVSHAHNDHGGGLGHFLSQTQDIPVYLSERAFDAEHYSYRRSGQARAIGLNRELATTYANRLRFIGGSTWIAPRIAVVRNSTHLYPLPLGNKYLTCKPIRGHEEADDFSHELSLAFVGKEGLVIVASCSHQGAANIIQSCQAFTGEQRVAAYVGGLHLVDDLTAEEEVGDCLSHLLRLAPQASLYTGHCTCDSAKEQITRHWEKASCFHVGSRLQFP